MNEQEQKLFNRMRYFIYAMVPEVLNLCGNSYSNAWCEQLLRIAKEANCYNGNVIGEISSLKQSFEEDMDNLKYRELCDIGDADFEEYLKIFCE